MNNNELELAMNKDLESGDWAEAITKASYLPPQSNSFEIMAAKQPMPDNAVKEILKLITHPWGQHSENGAGFLLQYSRNMPPDASSDLLNEIAKLMINCPDIHSTEAEENLEKHPNWNPDEELKSQKNAAKFWEEYEMNPDPAHLAVVKAMLTGSPSAIKDHKGRIGNSSDMISMVPDLRAHAEKSQELVLKDPDIEKHYIGDEPYIKVYRGANGNYGKILYAASEYNRNTYEANEKEFDIPIFHLSSWTLYPEVALDHARYSDSSENALVISALLPVKDILHSELHHTAFGQTHPRQTESEVVFAHPTGKLTINTKNLEFHPNDELSKNEKIIIEDLNKSTFKKLIPAVTALSMLGVSAPHTFKPEAPQAQIKPQGFDVSSLPKIKPPKIDPGLKPIGMIESSGGKNVAHKPLPTGAKAYGTYGIMPVQVLETIKEHPKLRHTYGSLLKLNYIKDQDKIYDALKTHPGLEHKIINSHWQKLNHVFGGDEDKMAYAWNHGITGTLNTPDEIIRNSDYVKKYHKFKKMLRLEQMHHRYRNRHAFHKKESDPEAHNDVEKFVPFTEDPQDQAAIDVINKAIKTGNLHNVNNVGHFTRDSFVAGFDKNNAWLLKIEPFGTRPSIQSAKYGLQSVKEVAFYTAAKDVFDLGKWTPKAILGETIRSGKPFPTAAIKMFPGQFISAHDQEKQRPGSMEGILEPLRRDGIIHKIAAMCYIMADADQHGRNILTDGTLVRVIDHGTSFADSSFDPSTDEKIYVPYILRRGIVHKKMDKEEKLALMPKIDNSYVREDLKHWIMNLDASKLNTVLEKFYIDPKPTLARLRMVQKLVADSNHPDQVINELWIVGFHSKLEKDA